MSNNESSIMVEYLDTLKMQNKALPSMAMSKIFRQFFTPQKYSQIMIENLNIDTPKKILDLSMGEGSLLIEAMKVWENSEFIGNDIDINCCDNIKRDYIDKIVCFNENIFKQIAIEKIVKSTGKVDLCLANPPFHLTPQDEDTKRILEKYDLNVYNKSEFIPAEVIFILQCLDALDNEGTLSIILPDGFFVNTYLQRFRNFLLNNYKIEKVIELPSNIFKKTDAKTHILILKNMFDLNEKIKLESIENNKKILIDKKEAVYRMDYSYYSVLENYNNKSIMISDKKLGTEFLRGKSKYLLKDINDEYILHTTNFSKTKIFNNKLESPEILLPYSDKIAIAGDIVLARVGTYCLGKVGMVENGYFIITDCIFIIRVKDIEIRNKIYNLLISIEGQRWIKAISKGVSAKHITLEDIKKFPLIKGDD